MLHFTNTIKYTQYNKIDKNFHFNLKCENNLHEPFKCYMGVNIFQGKFDLFMILDP